MAPLPSAHGGTGKSMLALQMAICVAMGFPFMNKKTIPSRVLFFSGEDSTSVVRHRLACICRVQKIDPTVLADRLLVIDSTENPGLYVTQNRDNISIDGYKKLLERSTAYSAGLIIIDNASDTFDANENERARVREFIRFLTQLAKLLNAAVLLLAHMDKDSVKYKSSSENYSGSTAWHNSVRSRLFLNIDKETQTLSLIQQKSNLEHLSEAINMRREEYGILSFFTLPCVDDFSMTILCAKWY
ncbi:AAA family ATPase [uncultured Legionella sp.]|uniref:AAA family ATPase n=1 Tax=uncultured Legionella sp. TaxID=210934 RepID=UPI0026147FB6|nr:AAA family ATPase [uncultured Legionella sp.]